MNDILEFCKIAFDSPLETLLIIFLFIAAIRGLYEGVKWIKGELNRWYQTRHTEEEQDENLRDRIGLLEEDNQRQIQTLKDINTTLDFIMDTLRKMTEDEKANTVALCRTQIWILYKKLKDQDTLTSAEYETFMDLADRYLKNGGNSVFKDKIIPYLKNIPVKD